nr:AraC family transcriptional regulator [Chromohalobacter sp. 296-RDG]
MASGFTSASSFSRAYKQHFGTSPRQARHPRPDDAT